MSVIFGACVVQGQVANEETMKSLAAVTRRYGPDGTRIICLGQLGMGFQEFKTHVRSSIDDQPTADREDNIVTLDGRLDNYLELAADLGLDAGESPDSALVLCAFRKWGKGCFAHFIGDWALALWCARDCCLYLARDHAGTRCLYYKREGLQTIWSTHLETFFAGGSVPTIERDYLTRSLCYLPTHELTPFEGILSVPAAHYVALQSGRLTTTPHWQCIPDTEIVYASDDEYDEHFMSLFRQAVERRLGDGDRLLAELSGGMDSTAIVCVADQIIKRRHSAAKRPDTLSFFDETEPDWDERPYFSAVESHRNKTGTHVDCSSRRPTYEPLILEDRIYPYVCGDRFVLDAERQLERALGPGRYRVILSGIGGDELLGGVPTGLPELANYLRAGQFRRLASRAAQWGLATRRPFYLMIQDALKFTIDLYTPRRYTEDDIPPWITSMHQRYLPQGAHHVGPISGLIAKKPSAIASGRAWWQMIETLPHLKPPLLGCYEYRYPYLDRDLVEFLLRTPREQLVQPNRRRLLMRRALTGTVPSVVLERRRKAIVSRRPIANLRSAQQKIETLFCDSWLERYGLIKGEVVRSTLSADLAGEGRWIGHLARLIEAELWLRSIHARNPMLTSFPNSDGVPTVLAAI
jgi:asparagine synthase (glutamine-hydrolysing)